MLERLLCSVARLNAQECPQPAAFPHFEFDMCFVPKRCALYQHLNLQMWSESLCFSHLYLDTCFAPQRRALFQHVNFQTRIKAEVFLAFWLSNALRALFQFPKMLRTRGFVSHVYLEMWFAPLPHFFHISTSKSAPKMRCFDHCDFEICFGPQQRAIFDLSSDRWLCTRRFSQPTFQPSGAGKLWKNTVSCDF